MTSIEINSYRTPVPVSSGAHQKPWLNNLGSHVMVDEIDALIAAGRGFHATVGLLTTPIVGGGNGTVYDPEQSEFVLNIPTGIYVKLLRVDIQLQAPLLAADNEECEAVIQLDTATVSTATASTGTAETLLNMVTNSAETSGCTAFSANTSDHNTPVVTQELAREVLKGDFQGTPANAMWVRGRLLYEPRYPLTIHGAAGGTGAAIYIYVGGTVAASMFAQIDFLAYTAAQAAALFVN